MPSTVLGHDRLGHRELFQRDDALLAAVTALAGAAEGQFDAAAGAIAVDEDLAGAHALRDALLAPAVLGPDGGDEAIIGAVGGLDRVVLVLEGEGGEDGAEDLLLLQPVAARHGAEQRRRDVEAAIRHSLRD